MSRYFVAYTPKNIDRRPGVFPDITAQGDDVVFRFPVTYTPIVKATRLVLRCDRDGEVWARLAPEDPARG